jgi:signal transduction histidine kinase/DNA-binding response OmpR family regulator
VTYLVNLNRRIFLNVAFICLVLSFNGSEIRAQSIPLDSLITAVKNLSEDGGNESRIEQLKEQSRLYYTQGLPEYLIGQLYSQWGDHHQKLYQFDSAISYYRKAIDQLIIESDPKRLADAYYALGGVYMDIEEYVLSAEILFKTLEIYDSLGMTRPMAKTLNSIGNTYYYSGDSQIAIDYYRRAIELYKQLDLPIDVSRVMGNMASMYNMIGQNDSAVIIYQTGLDLIEDMEAYQIELGHYCGLGIVMEETGRLDEAYVFYRKAFDMAKANKLDLDLAESHQNLGYYYLAVNQLDSAEWYAKKTLDYAERYHNFQLRSNAFEILHMTYNRQGRLKEAYEYLSLLRVEEDSIFDLTSARQLNALNAELEAARKERELARKDLELGRIESEVRAQKGTRNLLIAGLFFTAIIVVLVVRSQRINEKANVLLKKKNQEIQKKNEEIQLIEQAKNKWFVNIAHELRTPLTLIKGPVDHLMQIEGLEEDDKMLMSIASRNVQHLENLTNEILDLSKLEEGKVKLRMDVCDFVKMTRETVESFKSVAIKEGVTLTFNYVEGLPIFLNLDEQKFRKVLSNLLSNAIKFTPDEGEIQVLLKEYDGDISLKVIDSGVGINADEVEKIFDRFFQASNQKFSAHGGSGVGLSMSREITELHGGSLTCDSEPGKGSTFEVRLPASLKLSGAKIAELVEVEGPHSGHSQHIRKKKIFVADDNPDMRSYLESFLVTKYQTVLFADGKALMEKIKEEKPDLIISDIMMPRMDGSTLAKRLKENPEWRSIPFISVTAVADENEKLDVLRMGVDDYLIKPFNPEELLIRIENLLANRDEREKATDEDEIAEESFQERLVKQLEEVVKKYISDADFNVMRLADEVSMSERQLYRYLKQTTGLTPANFIKEIRLQRAFELARRNVYSTTAELSYEVGFQNPSYFTTVFRKRFGKKPSDFMDES